MAELYGKPYRARDLLRKVGIMDQLAAAEAFELADGSERGCRGVRLRNGSGLDVTVLTDRGMSLTDVLFEGISLAFKTPVGAVHPSFFSDKGLDWLRAWPGGFMTPCGLTHVGSPCSDEGEELGIHGRVTGIPAKQVSFGGKWLDDTTYEVSVEGQVRETAVFAENLVFTRRVSMVSGESRLVVEDRFANEGFEPSPLMILQHTNLGFPLVDEGARLLLPPGKTHPRDAEAEKGLASCREFTAPSAGFKEQVYFHELEAAVDGMVTVGFLNETFNGGEGLALSFTYRLEDYPCLVEWEMMGEGMYVVGVEPSNCRVGGRAAARADGSLQFIQPGEVKTARIEIEARRGPAALALEKEIVGG